MKKAQSVGLIGTGSLTDSPLTRFWWLSERLGPVKSASYRVASRIANMLRAGHPVKDYAEFESCALILVCVPEETVPQVVSEMISAGDFLARKSRGAMQHLAGQRRAARAFRARRIRGIHQPDSRFRRRALSGGGRPPRHSPVEEPGGVSRAARGGHRAASQAASTWPRSPARTLHSPARVAFESLQHRIPPASATFWNGRSLAPSLVLKGGRRAYPSRANSPDNCTRFPGNPELALPGAERRWRRV